MKSYYYHAIYHSKFHSLLDHGSEDMQTTKSGLTFITSVSQFGKIIVSLHFFRSDLHGLRMLRNCKRQYELVDEEVPDNLSLLIFFTWPESGYLILSVPYLSS